MFNFPDNKKLTQDDLIKGSITQKTLSRIVIASSILVVSATFVGYQQMFSLLRDQRLEQLSSSVTTRVEREQEVFQLAADNHQILKQQIIEQIEDLATDNLEEEFNSLFVRFPDGVVRNRPENFDGERQAGVHIDPSLSITPELQGRVLMLQRLIESYGRAWHNRFQSTFVMTPDNIIIVYWPEFPTWSQETSATLNMPDQEEYEVATPANNPERTTVCTSPYLEEVSEIWLVSCSTPVEINDQPIATVAHDIRLNSLIERTIDDHIEGGYNLIFNREGKLIAHPNLMEKISESTVAYSIAESEDPHLRHIFELVTNAPSEEGIIDNKLNGEYLAVQSIPTPNWYFVTVLPKNTLREKVLGIAVFNAIFALIFLGCLSVALGFIIRSQIATPLKELIRATRQISAGDYSVLIQNDRQDEIGILAKAFNLMADEISQRNQALESALLKQQQLLKKVTETLENQETSVQQVTTSMDELSASSRSSADQASEAAKGAHRVLSLIEGQDNLVESYNHFSLQENVKRLTTEIGDLNQQVNKIGIISAVVSDLANQTNMLALNAAVEAVRSGVNGAGFNVIAEEIRRLSDQSQSSAAAINHLVEKIQSAMSSTVQVTSDSQDALQTVVSAVNHIVVNSEQISLNTHQQSVAIEQILATMKHLKGMGKEGD
ncbi:methyl-accepting chemotaxis protein [Spirulina subsalsa]|uniref:methyl-accepting chemotaxis protein n=1 Tax=Spirulina subsalsa TaxID=54311 RepID=UPI0002D4506C|nr:methyl-accepting chemotaxis protein [Spirulina subsalsa]